MCTSKAVFIIWLTGGPLIRICLWSTTVWIPKMLFWSVVLHVTEIRVSNFTEVFSHDTCLFKMKTLHKICSKIFTLWTSCIPKTLSLLSACCVSRISVCFPHGLSLSLSFLNWKWLEVITILVCDSAGKKKSSSYLYVRRFCISVIDDWLMQNFSTTTFITFYSVLYVFHKNTQ
jgi:hypothetical protein